MSFLQDPIGHRDSKNKNNSTLRCDRLNSCSVPVSSSLFGDPCPGTHKYVEIHYTCSPKTDTTRRPLPPWYLQQPSLQSHSDNWLPNPASHSEDLTSGNSYSSRIPILVATTTSQPRRIPITTPRPTTTTSSTTTAESVTSDLYAEDEDEVTVPQVDETQEVIEEVEEGEITVISSVIFSIVMSCFYRHSCRGYTDSRPDL